MIRREMPFLLLFWHYSSRFGGLCNIWEQQFTFEVHFLCCGQPFRRLWSCYTTHFLTSLTCSRYRRTFFQRWPEVFTCSAGEGMSIACINFSMFFQEHCWTWSCKESLFALNATFCWMPLYNQSFCCSALIRYDGLQIWLSNLSLQE